MSFGVTRGGKKRANLAQNGRIKEECVKIKYTRTRGYAFHFDCDDAFCLSEEKGAKNASFLWKARFKEKKQRKGGHNDRARLIRVFYPGRKKKVVSHFCPATQK